MKEMLYALERKPNLFIQRKSFSKTPLKITPILCILSMLVVWTDAFAQLPMYHKGIGSGGNTIPMNTAGSHCQQIYEPADFNTMPISGLITKVYFRNTTAGTSGTYTNFSVSFLQNSMVAFPNSTFLTGFTPALTASNIAINGNATAGGWYEIPLDVPFAYDNSQTLIVEIKYDSRTGGMSNPTSTAVGNKRLSIITAPGAATGNLSTIWGDFGIDVIPATPCAGANGGTIAASASSVCPATAFSIIPAGTTMGLTTEYQWQASDNGIVWNDIPGQTGYSFNSTQSAATNYRLRVVCGTSSDTAYSNTVFVDLTPFLNCYCTSNATATTNTSIRNVTLSNLNYTSATACNQYESITSDTAVLNPGVTYPVSITVEDCEGTGFGTQRSAIFIDWNRNGLFTDPGEQVYDPGTLPGAATVVFSGNITVPPFATPGLTRMRVINKQATTAVDPCGTYTTGETEDYLVNVLAPPANEAGIAAITKPQVSICSLGQEVWVELQNLGTSPLTQATFQVEVNGLPLVVGPWTGNVPPQSSLEVQVPVSYVFADGDSIVVRVSQPNGQAEDPLYAFNNMKAGRYYASLSGVKTVYGTGSDFANLNVAIQAINLRGVCDTVYFDVAPGNYGTQHVFTSYTSASNNPLVVIRSASGTAADVNFSYNASAAADNFVFQFDGASNYEVRNITLTALGTTNNRVVDIINGSSKIILDGNELISDTTGTYSTTDLTRIVVCSPTAANNNNITVRNNHIVGGNRGVHLVGTADNEMGNVIEGNLIEAYAYAGIYLSNQYGFDVLGNTLRGREDLTTSLGYGVYVTGTIGGGTIDRNQVVSYRRGSSIYLTTAQGGSTPLRVTNNFLFQGDTLAAAISSGVYILNANSTKIEVANNSISLWSTNASSAGILIADGSNISLFNNNVASFNTSPVLKVDKTYTLFASNNNNLFGQTIANYGGALHTTLASYQTASGHDAASVSVTPGYNGTDLHTCAPELNAAGVPLSYVTADFDGDNRTSSPDIGADEFLGGPIGLIAEDSISKCVGAAVSIGNSAFVGATYSWTPGSATTSEISVTTAGTYTVSATSACGTFSDDAVVVDLPTPTASYTVSTVSLAAIFVNTSTNATSYLWDFGDGSTSTDQNPTHVYASASTYSVSLTVTNECGTSVYGPFPVNVINAGIEENMLAALRIFPNPTDGIFTVDLAGLSNSDATIEIIDVTGKVLMSRNVPAGNNQVSLDATSFASGVYSVKVSVDGASKTLRIIKN